MIEDPHIEAVARVLAEQCGDNPDKQVRKLSGESYPQWHEMAPDAQEVLAAADAAAWRPMENAPRDGTRILLLSRLSYSDPTEKVQLGYFQPADSDDEEDCDGWFTDKEWWPDDDFDRWRPLPTPPQEQDT